jgi:glucokinase
MPSGGLFLAGGIPPKLMPMIGEKMAEHYLNDSVMAGVISTFPLYLVMNDDLGLLGAKVRAMRLI